MISVERVLNTAKDIVLSQLPIKENENAILRAIDLGVVELYRRFNLSIDTEVQDIVPNVHVYKIKDESVSQLLYIYDPVNSRNLNSPEIYDNDFDYKQLNYRTFIITKPEKYKQLIFIYKSNIKKAITNKYDVIDIPLDFYNALVDFVAYKCHITLNNDNLKEMDTHYKRFELACADLVNSGFKQEYTNSWQVNGGII